jgi:hypothetical protein
MLPAGLPEAMGRIPTCRRDEGLERDLWLILDCPADSLEISLCGIITLQNDGRLSAAVKRLPA